jgi:hypothetical protein
MNTEWSFDALGEEPVHICTSDIDDEGETVSSTETK